MALSSRTKLPFLHEPSCLKKWSWSHLTTFFYSYIGTTAKYIGYPNLKWSPCQVSVAIWLIWLRVVGQETSTIGRPKIKRVKIAIRRRPAFAWWTAWAAQGQREGEKKKTKWSEWRCYVCLLWQCGHASCTQQPHRLCAVSQHYLQ